MKNEVLWIVMMTVWEPASLIPSYALQAVVKRSDAYWTMKGVMESLRESGYQTILAHQLGKPGGWQNKMVTANGRGRQILVYLQPVELVVNWEFLGPSPAQKIVLAILNEPEQDFNRL